MTEQSQLSEISEILRSRRVTSYGVLRLCRGLGAPRGYMGLAYDRATDEWLVNHQ
jgi:hypothetical protein